MNKTSQFICIVTENRFRVCVMKHAFFLNVININNNNNEVVAVREILCNFLFF